MQSPTWRLSISTRRDRLGGAGRVVEGGADDGNRVADGGALLDRVDGAAESSRPVPLTVVAQPASIAIPTSAASTPRIAHPRTAPLPLYTAPPSRGGLFRRVKAAGRGGHRSRMQQPGSQRAVATQSGVPIPETVSRGRRLRGAGSEIAWASRAWSLRRRPCARIGGR